MKLKIHYTCYLTLIMSFFAGFFREYLLALCLLIAHEGGHLLFLHKAKQNMSLTFLPFGGIIKYSKTTKVKQLKEFQIAFGGLLVNIILGVIFYCFDLKTLYNINLLLTIFNAVPIFPLDGGRIMALILASVMPYKKSLIATYFTSICVILLAVIINLIFIHSLFVYLALLMLLIENIKYLTNLGHEYLVFLLDKYLNYSHDKPKMKRALSLKNPLNRLFFYYNSEFYVDNLRLQEEKLLANHFKKETKKNPKKVINVI